jgi:hypothetical protein
MDRLDVRERLDRELLVNTYWQSNTCWRTNAPTAGSP